MELFKNQSDVSIVRISLGLNHIETAPETELVNFPPVPASVPIPDELEANVRSAMQIVSFCLPDGWSSAWYAYCTVDDNVATFAFPARWPADRGAVSLILTTADAALSIAQQKQQTLISIGPDESLRDAIDRKRSFVMSEADVTEFVDRALHQFAMFRNDAAIETYESVLVLGDTSWWNIDEESNPFFTEREVRMVKNFRRWVHRKSAESRDVDVVLQDDFNPNFPQTAGALV